MPLVCGRTVAIMDQHAAAERIRLEQLQHEVARLQGENQLLDPWSILNTYDDSHSCGSRIMIPEAVHVSTCCHDVRLECKHPSEQLASSYVWHNAHDRSKAECCGKQIQLYCSSAQDYPGPAGSW